jgi:hypothetical protein
MPRPRMDAARISSVLPDGTYPEVDAVLATLGHGPPPDRSWDVGRACHDRGRRYSRRG